MLGDHLEHKNPTNKLQHHAICIAYPSQGHITPMLHLSKLLHSKGFHITFFNSLHNHSCVLQSRGPTALGGGLTFQFLTFSDGLPPSESGLPRPNLPLMRSLECHSDGIFEEVIRKVRETSSGRPPVSVIICDPMLPFNLDAARELVDCPVVLFTPSTPSSFLAHSQSDTLLSRGILPFKDPGFMTDGSLDVKLDLEPASMNGMRLRDLPSQIRTIDKNSHVFEYMKHVMARCYKRPIIFNTFNALDHDVLKDLSKDVLHGPIYTIGPLHCLSNNLTTQLEIDDIGSNIWKEELHCLEWLDSQIPNSVIYASFGSTTTTTNEQLIEFAWGLANSKHPFLWVIRPDIVIGQSAILPKEFENEVKGRGLILSWCPQERVLSHPSVAVFLTHCGWNSMLESISNGVPVICWPYQGDNQPISWWSCYKWGIGVELDIVVKRDQVERLIRDVLEDEKGKKLKIKAMELKILVENAISENGSSNLDLDRFVDYVASLNNLNNGLVVEISSI
ncbi:hypothetical protein vseg_000316 [Gypsophila vaccaria]